MYMDHNQLEQFHREISEKLGGIRAELKSLSTELNRMNNCIEENKKKIILLEIWKSNINGKIAVISAAIGAAVTFAIGWIRDRI